MTTKRSLKKDEQAVSPVIAVIMLIAITVIIAAVVAAFAYGIIGGVKKAPSAALVVEGAQSNPSKIQVVNIFHHGGDPITGAFSNVVNTTDTIEQKMNFLQVRLNGAPVTIAIVDPATLNGNETDCGTSWKTDFQPGDQLSLSFAQGTLNQGDSLIILHTPSENILQRITIS